MSDALSQRAKLGKPSMTMAITAKAKALKAEGKDVISFAAGEPDFRTPDNICNAAHKAIDDGLHTYTPNPGSPLMRKTVCEWFKRENGLDYTPEQILVSPGAKFNIYLAIQAMVDEGDEVLIPAPYWVSYPEMVKLAGGIPVIVNTNAKNGFELTAEMLEEKITDKTKLLILNSPSNPSGAIVSPEQIAAIGKLLEEKGLYCVSDEIYMKLLYGAEEHVSIAAVSEYAKNHTVVINGCSKAYAMTGWRIGFSGAPLEITNAMASIQSQSTSNACSIAQAAAVEALSGDQSCVEQMRLEFAKRRDLIVALLNDIEGIACANPGGAFYVFPDVSALFGKTIAGRQINTAFELCELALEMSLVACVPGEAFGSDNNMRLSYATSSEQIKAGCLRLKELIEGA